MLESNAEELENNKDIICVSKKSDGGITSIDLILEPDKFEKLSSECRLTCEEYCEVINNIVDEEDDYWSELRMKDQINITRDSILQATILKYAKENLGINHEDFIGKGVNYIKRYNKQGVFLGESVVVSIASIPMMEAKILK